MANLYSPHLIILTVSDSSGNIEPDTYISIVTDIGSKDGLTTDSLGRLIYDLSSIGYTDGSTCKITIKDQFNNEYKEHSFTIEGKSTELDLALIVRTKNTKNIVGYSSKSVLQSVGNMPITKDNPLDINIQDISKGTQTNDIKVTLNGESITIQEPLSIDDNGGSITVDGTFWQATQPISGTIASTQSGTWNIGTLNSITDDVSIEGDVAHSISDSGHPVKIGGKSYSSEPSAVTPGDRVNAYFDLYGYQHMRSVGTVAHDSADFSNPIKIGAKAKDYHPDSDEEQGEAEVSNNDRVNITTNLRGQQIEGVNSRYNVLDNVSTTYDADPTTATSTAIDCWNYREASISFSLVSVGSPTTIQFIVECSNDGTNFEPISIGWLQNWIFEDTEVASVLPYHFPFKICCQKIRLKVVAVGTNGLGNTFTVTNAAIYLRN